MKWTEEKIQILKNNRHLSDKELSNIIGCTEPSYKNKNIGYFLYCGKNSEINKFFDYIGSCDIQQFKYKWKRPITTRIKKCIRAPKKRTNYHLCKLTSKQIISMSYKPLYLELNLIKLKHIK